MCGIVGIVNFKKNIKDDYKNLLISMSNELNRRGPDEEGYIYEDHAVLAHKRLSVVDFENGKQPMSYIYNDNKYIIIYNGQIYNSKEIREDLKEDGLIFNGYSDTEVILKGFCKYGYEICNKLNGIFAFAIWNDNKQEIYIARDHFGVKPLYYSFYDDNLIFASEIKAILKFKGIENVIDDKGLLELFALGPSHSPGNTPYKNIKELEPANYMILNENLFKKVEYWKLVNKEHEDSLSDTCENIRYLLKDSIERQMVSDAPIGCLLSGGLDSSIITRYANDIYFKKYGKKIKTFSVHYENQKENFVRNDFQPDMDDNYIDLMVQTLGTEHKKITIDSNELFYALNNAVIARDMPGMADVDSSYLLFFKEIKKDITVALSGECSDEIFGGYPWYFKEELINSNTFPWSNSINERCNFLNEEINEKINIKEYIEERYKEMIDKVRYLYCDSETNKLHRKLIYLTSNYFMQTLLDRTDRMCMYNGLEVRVPFCDYRLVEYVWNIPWEMKAYKGREKGLLRYALEGELPDEIIYRKKSPYPKTYNPIYIKLVEDKVKQILGNENSPINTIINKKFAKEIIESNGEKIKKPWFGQLMTGTQFLAYIIQVNEWLEIYKPKIIV